MAERHVARGGLGPEVPVVRSAVVNWLRVAVLVGSVVSLHPAPAACDEAVRASRRVLIVQPFGQHFEPFTSVAAGFRTALAARSSVPIEFSEISLETARFAEGDVEETLAEYLAVLFAERQPDLVVPVGASALRFCTRYHERICPDVPLVAMGVESRHLRDIDVDDNAVTVTFRADLTGAVESALEVLPETRHIAAVIGRSPHEQFWQAEAERALAAFGDRVEVTWLSEFSFPEISRRVASLPRHSIIFYFLMVVDADGVPYEYLKALDTLHDAANAPIFGVFEEQLGRGVVGGRLIRAREIGVRTADVATRILDNGSASGITDLFVPGTGPVYDWRELERWGIPEARLPAGSEVRYRGESFWEKYTWHVAIVASLLVAQSLLIGGLLYHRRRLQATQARLSASQQSLDELHGELRHVARVSLIGQLTTALTHELGQPLGAILRNADAAELFLGKETPDLEEVRAILVDIRRDDQRASAVIERLRALLKHQRIEMSDLSWNSAVREILDVLRSDAVSRGVLLESDIPEDLPLVRGDRVHLQQVLINLIVNAMDALASNGNGDRRVRVSARLREDGRIESTVRDNGAGLPNDSRADIFEPFVTTKAKGLGVGLAICRSIVEAHGGTLWAENNPDGGASFRFVVPSVREVEVS